MTATPNPTDFLAICKRTFDDKNLLHSIDDQPGMVTPNGGQMWYKNGVLHRLTGPALIYKDEREWFISAKNVTDVVTKWAKDNQYASPNDLTPTACDIMWISLGLDYDDRGNPIFNNQ